MTQFTVLDTACNKTYRFEFVVIANWLICRSVHHMVLGFGDINNIMRGRLNLTFFSEF